MEPYSQDRPSRIAFREKIVARVEAFHGDNTHDEKSHGGGESAPKGPRAVPIRNSSGDIVGYKSPELSKVDWNAWEEAQKSAVDVVPSTHRGKFWLNAEGKFVRPPGKVQVHIAVIPQKMQTPRGPDYKAFAHATKAIRVVVSPVESTVHIWENPNGAQRDALSQLLRQTTVLQGDRDNGTSLAIKYLNHSAEDHFGAGLAQVVRFVRGEGEPGQKLVEFKLTDAEREAKYDLGERFVLPTWDYVPYLPEYETLPEDHEDHIKLREELRLQGEEFHKKQKGE